MHCKTRGRVLRVIACHISCPFCNLGHSLCHIAADCEAHSNTVWSLTLSQKCLAENCWS